MNKADERKWVQAARTDPQALMRLYDEYFPRLWAYVRYRISVKQDVEDIVADIFLKVVRDIGKFEWRHNHSFAGWLFKIAANEVADFHRRQRVETRLQATLSSAETVNPQARRLENALTQQEIFLQARALINQLSPRRQEIITLKFFGQLRNQEIAAILELDERTVAAHLCRGLKDLYRRFTEISLGENGKVF